MRSPEEFAGTKNPGAWAELCERSGIDPSDIGRVERVNLWEGFYKDADGDAHKVDMSGISLVPRWADGPEWPVVQPGPRVRLPAPKAHPKTPADPVAVVLPDMQIGYFRNADGTLEPTHDEAAIAIALAVTKAAKPAQVVLVGDNADLPELSKYRLTPAYAQTTQATIDRCGVLCAELRRAAPGAEIIWLAGNHEERLPNYLLDNAKAAFGLRQANTPESWPVLSMPYLCNMDDHDITYVPGYPASHHWITPRLKVIHGDLVKSNGSTAHAYLGREKTSVIFGHVHRREYAARTRDDHDGPREVMAATPGCLCRTDGAIPSTKGATDLDGRPLYRQEDWQAGLAVIPYDEAGGEFDYQQVAIHTRSDGSKWALWNGKRYEG